MLSHRMRCPAALRDTVRRRTALRGTQHTACGVKEPYRWTDGRTDGCRGDSDSRRKYASHVCEREGGWRRSRRRRRRRRR